MKRKQYFITNHQEITVSDKGFCKYSVPKYTVFYHQEIDFTTSCIDDQHIVLLGFIINPYEPTHSNQQIVDVLATHKTHKALFKALELLSGKYVLFYVSKDEQILVTDCFAERQLYYWKNKDFYYISSSDKLILETLSLQLQIADEKKALLQDPLFLHINEHWLLSEEDWDDRFKKLLPNHFLDIKRHETKRLPIFVNSTLDEHSTSQEIQKLLKNTIEAITLRYDAIYLPITAGYDSRLLLAASIHWKDKIKYYIFNTGKTYVLRDVKIATKLAHYFQLNFKEIKLDELTEAFKKEYSNYFIVPRFLSKTRNIAWFKAHIKKPSINLSGGGDYLRGFYNEDDFTSIKKILSAIEYEDLPIHTNAIKKWLTSAVPYAKEYNVPISDLFYHELRMGKWASKMYHESDMTAMDYFSPLNNRHIVYSILLNIPESKRHASTSPFYRTLMEGMLPNATKIPFNPKTWRDHIKSMIPYNRIKKQFRLFRYGKG